MSDHVPRTALTQPLKAGVNPFAEGINPYAAPGYEGFAPPAMPAGITPFAGLWRQGNVLVMHKRAPLPDICLKSNEPAKQRLKRHLSWHHPAVFLLVLVSLLIYVIVALIIRKTATISIALSDQWLARRRRRMIVAWTAILLCAFLFAVAVPNADSAPWAPFALIFAIVAALVAAIYGLLACRMVWPQRMTDEYIWLKGVHPDFLARLEAWQWNL